MFPHELAASEDILLIAEGKFYRVEKLPHYKLAIVPYIEPLLPMYEQNNFSFLDRLMDAVDSISEWICNFFGF